MVSSDSIHDMGSEPLEDSDKGKRLRPKHEQAKPNTANEYEEKYSHARYTHSTFSCNERPGFQPITVITVKVTVCIEGSLTSEIQQPFVQLRFGEVTVMVTAPVTGSVNQKPH